MTQLPRCSWRDYGRQDWQSDDARCQAPANGWLRKNRRYGHNLSLCAKHRYKAVRGHEPPSPLILTLAIRQVISLKRWGWQGWVGPDVPESNDWLGEFADAGAWPA